MSAAFENKVTFSYQYLLTVAKDIFKACGAPSSEADIVAHHLVTSNLMGLDSHGVIRIPQYVRMVQNHDIIPGAPVTIVQETPNTAIVDAGWNFGQVGAVRATEAAIQKAKVNSIGCVVVRRCNHIGRLGAYTQMAAEHNLIAMAVCSSYGGGRFVAPWGGREGKLATNPISFAAPGSANLILIDISTSVVSEGKIRLMRDSGKPLPEGWILDAQGRPSTDPNDFYGPPMGVILPLGGEAGYKGYFLSLIVEILGTLLGRAPLIDITRAPGNGLWLMVLDIAAFMQPDDFRLRIDELIAYMKSSPLASGFDEITVPGEMDFKQMERRKKEGIPLGNSTWQQIQEVAIELGLRL